MTRLFARPFRQFGAADAFGKTEVILDLGAGSGLAANCKVF